jgi:hypothetical protein
MPVPTETAVRDKSQNLLEHLPRDYDLGYLEHDVAAVAHHLGSDLDISFSLRVVSDQSLIGLRPCDK